MNDSRREALLGPVRAMQIIVVALAMGIVLFAGIVVGVIVGPAQLQPQAGFMTYLAAAMATITIGLSFIVPRFMIIAARRRIAAGTWELPGQGTAMPEALAQLGDEGPLVIVYQTALIVGAARVRGTGLLGVGGNDAREIAAGPGHCGALPAIGTSAISNAPSRRELARFANTGDGRGPHVHAVISAGKAPLRDVRPTNAQTLCVAAFAWSAATRSRGGGDHCDFRSSLA